MFSLTMPAAMRRRMDDWFARHNPPSRDAILLHNRRLYILPTRFGYLFAFMLVTLFLAAINYENSMAFVLTFMLIALGIVSLWHTHKNLLNLQVSLKTPKAVFNGEDCELEFSLQHANNNTRYAVGLQYAEENPLYFTVPSQTRVEGRLKIATGKRGQFQPKPVYVYTRYPTGLFHAWGWLKFETPILVYPKPVNSAVLEETVDEHYASKTSTSTIEGDDFAGLREHREGESLRHISWKAYAQGKGLLTKTFQGHARPSLWLDWLEMPRASLEEKLSYMTALVLFCTDEQLKFGMKLPGNTIAQQSGSAHKYSCLSALACFQQTDLDTEFEPAHDNGQ